MPIWATPEDGLQALAEAHTLVDQQEERWWAAEVYRLRGVLLLKAEKGGRSQSPCATAWAQRSFPPPTQSRRGRRATLAAEECFQQALDVASRQEAKLLELRAAMSLSRLWQQQGKQAEAHELLAPIYGWFTEGFDTADLQEAKALLAALA